MRGPNVVVKLVENKSNTKCQRPNILTDKPDASNTIRVCLITMYELADCFSIVEGSFLLFQLSTC